MSRPFAAPAKALLAFSFLIQFVVAQQRPVPKAIDYLIQCPDTFNIISGWVVGLLPDSVLPPGLGMDYQYLLKNKKGLFCGINGTGQLYRISNERGYLRFDREDATYLSGHNFFSANFYYGGHFYSLGGYGFWHQNGMLRKYNDFTRDWQPVMLDEERPLMVGINSFFWLDAPEGKVYINPYVYRPEGFHKTPVSTSNDSLLLSCLDLNSGVWHDLGRMNKVPMMNFQIPAGVVELGVYDAGLYDFRNNRVYAAGKSLKDKLTRLKPGLNNNVYFYKDSTLYFANLSSDVLDSVILTAGDFIFKGEQVYKAGNRPSEKKDMFPAFWWILPLVTLLLLLVFILWQPGIKQRIDLALMRRARGRKGLAVKDQEALNRKDPGAIFTTLELELLQFIFPRDGENEPVRVDEINKLLGLSEKNESVQKKNRNEVINSINQKWALIGGGTPDLLMRQRSAFDKRIYFYCINPDARELLGKFLSL